MLANNSTLINLHKNAQLPPHSLSNWP